MNYYVFTYPYQTPGEQLGCSQYAPMESDDEAIELAAESLLEDIDLHNGEIFMGRITIIQVYTSERGAIWSRYVADVELAPECCPDCGGFTVDVTRKETA